MPHLSDDVIPHGAGAARPRVALSDEVVAFIESGLSIVVGVVGPAGRAQTGRALAARVLPDATIRVIFADEGNDAVVASARAGGPIAATFSAPMSHRTLQIKGFTSRLEEYDAEDAAATERQCDAFAGVLEAVSHPPAFVQAFLDYRQSKLWVLSFPMHEAYEQTPGPGAGRTL
jgi:hypothetical protein